MSNREPQTEFFCPRPGDYILVKMPIGIDDYSLEEVQKLHQELQDKFCNNTVITIPDNIDLEVVSKEELREIIINLLVQIEEDIYNDNLHGRIMPL